MPPAKKAAPTTTAAPAAPPAKKTVAKAPAPKPEPSPAAPQPEDLAGAQQRLGEKAVKQWQKANGYRPDGILTAKQFQRMLDSA